MYMHNLRGEQGGVFINDTTATTPDTGTSHWAMGVAIEDTVISAITMPGFTNSDALVGVTIFAGTPIYGRIDSITLTSGTIQMFNYIDPSRGKAKS